MRYWVRVSALQLDRLKLIFVRRAALCQVYDSIFRTSGPVFRRERSTDTKLQRTCP